MRQLGSGSGREWNDPGRCESAGGGRAMEVVGLAAAKEVATAWRRRRCDTDHSRLITRHLSRRWEVSKIPRCGEGCASERVHAIVERSCDRCRDVDHLTHRADDIIAREGDGHAFMICSVAAIRWCVIDQFGRDNRLSRMKAGSEIASVSGDSVRIRRVVRAEVCVEVVIRGEVTRKCLRRAARRQ